MGRSASRVLPQRAARALAWSLRNHLLWRRLPQRLAVPSDIEREAYFSRYERHYLFFRTLDNGDLGVMSILHEKMGMAVRLREDLSTLDAKGTDSD